MNDPITTFGLLAGYALFLFPLAVILWSRTGLTGKMIIAVIRMTAQLLLVGFYLQFVFRLDLPWLNILWLLIMIFIADISVIKGAQLKVKILAFPLFLALLIGIAIPLLYFITVILNRPSLFEARFVIPIGGMILGNCLRANIIGLNRFYHSIQQSEKAFCQSLADGASLTEATTPYLRDAITDSVTPTLATMATIGLVSLPGMMTGVILGGSDPTTAIRYQIAIMIAIFTGTNITVLLGIILSQKKAFTPSGTLNKNILNQN